MFGDAHPATSRAVQLEKKAKRVSARLGWCARKIAFKAPVLRCNAGRGTLRFCNNHAKPEPDRDNIWVQVCPLENDCIHFSGHYAVRNCAETDLPTGAAREPICRLFQNGTAANNTVNRGKSQSHFERKVGQTYYQERQERLCRRAISRQQAVHVQF
jgi:hypothetical protein